MADAPPPDQLATATSRAKEQAYFMKRALDASHTAAALAHACSMIAELKTQALPPKQYYELYITVTQEMRHLTEFFKTQLEKGKPMLELYEVVQHASGVLPRLYLLINVGGVYIQSKQASARDILRDLVEMCRGVQQPMKGLFLRNYMLQTSKDKLPDTGSEFEGQGGGIADAIGFILTNFCEMTRLWVRMQHQSAISDRSRRERERTELKLLVGTNLVRLSQMDGVTLDVYRQMVVVPVLEQVVNTKDALAQEYLMESIMQVFPVEYHVATLSTILKHLENLSASTDVNVILLNIMERLKTYKPNKDEVEEDSIFTPLATHAAAAVRAAGGLMPPAKVVALHTGLIDLALGAYPERLTYVDTVYSACATELSKYADSALSESESTCELKKFLKLPFELFGNALEGLQLASWPRLLSLLSHGDQVEVSSAIVSSILEQERKITDPQLADKLLTFAAPLLREDPSYVPKEDETQTVDDTLVAQIAPLSRIIHALGADHTDVCARVLNVVYKYAAVAPQRRAPLALTPLIFSFLKLAKAIKQAIDSSHINSTKVAEDAKNEDAIKETDIVVKDEAAQEANDQEAEDNDASAEGTKSDITKDVAVESADDPSSPANTSVPALEVSCHKLLSFMPRMVAIVAGVSPELALRLYLQCALVADSCGEEDDAYEFLTQAFTLYEDEISSQAAQVSAITLITATLPWLVRASVETYDTLAASSTKYSYKLLKKPDQSRAVAKASYQFWPTVADKRSPQRVLDCLQRALRIAADCKASNAYASLFVEALDAYLWHFEQGNELVTVTYLNSLLQLIEQHLSEEPDKRADHHIRYANTRRHIELKAAEFPDRYKGLQLVPEVHTA